MASAYKTGGWFSGDPKSASVLAPGGRPFHTLIQTCLTQNGQPQMSLGVMRGDMRPQRHVQTGIRMLD